VNILPFLKKRFLKSTYSLEKIFHLLKGKFQFSIQRLCIFSTCTTAVKLDVHTKGDVRLGLGPVHERS